MRFSCKIVQKAALPCQGVAKGDWQREITDIQSICAYSSANAKGYAQIII